MGKGSRDRRRAERDTEPLADARPEPASAGYLRDILLACVVLLLLNLLAFSTLRSCGFVYDDSLYVSGEPHVARGLTFKTFRWALTSFDGAIWNPVTRLSHLLDVSLFGMEPGPQHLTSLGFHVANSILLFALFAAMTGKAWRSLLVAALFAVHPLHVEAVAWISSRKDLLSTFFGLATIGAWFLWTMRPGVGRYVLVVLLFALGLAAKPMIVTLPFVLLLIDAWPLERISWTPGPPRDGRITLARSILEKLPLLGLSVASSVIAFVGQKSGGALSSVVDVPLTVRLGNAVVALGVYVRKTFWPSDLAAFYPHPFTSWPASRIALSLAMVAGVSFFALRHLRSRPSFAFGWFFFLGTLVPVLGLVQFGGHAWADRFTYVPLIGLFIAIVWGVADALPDDARRRVAGGFAVLVVVGLALASRRQAAVWVDDETLFRHALAVTPDNWVAHQYVGVAAAKDGATDEAIGHFTEALRIRPGYAAAHNNLGAALQSQGRLDEAIAEFRSATASESGYAEAHENLGVALASSGKNEEGLAELESALRLRPDSPQGHYNAAVVSGLLGGRDDVARRHYEEALRLDPGNVQARFNFAVLLRKLGDRTGAERELRETLRLRPDLEQATAELASLQTSPSAQR